MQRTAISKTIPKLRNNPNPLPLSSHFHSTSISLAKWKSNSKDDGVDQQPSKPSVRFSVREKRPDASRALKDLLLNRKQSKHRMQDETSAPCGEDFGSRRKDSHPNANKSKTHTSSCSGRGKHSAGKRWQSKKRFYDEDDNEQPEGTFSATFGGKSYTWSFGSSNNAQNSTSGFEWRDDAKQEKEKKRIWNESDIEDEQVDLGSHSHRVALGLPPTGPLKLDDVKCAFRVSALKWHPDKHQGPSQAIAEERFKLCVDAYNSLYNALKSA